MLYPFFFIGGLVSTKIFNGVRLKNIITVEETISFANEIRPIIEQGFKTNRANDIKRMACLVYDSFHCLGIDEFEDPDEDRIPLLRATSVVCEHSDDYDYSISVGTHDGIIVALPFFSNDDYALSKFFNHPNVSPFPYWDNTDPDDTVSEQEWKQRKLIWDAVLGNSGIPKDEMLNICLFSTKYLLPDDSYMQTMPSIEERTKVLIDRVTSSRVVKKEKETNGTSEDGNDNFISNVIK